MKNINIFRVKKQFILMLLLVTAVMPLSARTLKVMASFTVLADVVKQVGGEHVQVSSLVGNNGDPHKYEPSARDSRNLRKSDVVFISGCGLETWFERLARAANAKEVVVVSEGIEVGEFEEDGEIMADPHVWNDPENVKIWVKNIRDALIAVDPEDKADFIANAELYDKLLDALDDYALSKLTDFPREKKKVLTNHDAFSYLGRAYDVTFIAPLGVSTETEASAKDVKRLIDQMKREGVKVYFMENSNDPRLVRQIARATKAQPGGTLFPEALSEEVPTFYAMFKHNIDLIASGIQKSL